MCPKREVCGTRKGRGRVEGETLTKARDAKTQQNTMPHIRVYNQAHKYFSTSAGSIVYTPIPSTTDIKEYLKQIKVHSFIYTCPKRFPATVHTHSHVGTWEVNIGETRSGQQNKSRSIASARELQKCSNSSVRLSVSRETSNRIHRISARDLQLKKKKEGKPLRVTSTQKCTKKRC